MTIRATAVRTRALGAIAIVAIAGCNEIQFDRQSLVKSWRPLAIVVEPPEVNPGQDAVLTPLIVDPSGAMILDPAARGLTYTWTACFLSDTAGGGFSGMQYMPEDEQEDCDPGRENAFELPMLDTGEGIVPGLATAQLFSDEMLDQVAMAVGDQLTREQIERLVNEVGFPITVQLTVTEGETTLLRAVKRILLSRREDTNANPPDPRFQVGGDWVSGRDVDEPFRCVPEDGTAPVVPAGTDVILAPATDDGLEPEGWRETYSTLDLLGDLTAEFATKEEGAFYSWFSTAGRMQEEVTHQPLREEIWRSPRTPGTHPIWLVVRDGHGGTSACQVDVVVE